VTNRNRERWIFPSPISHANNHLGIYLLGPPFVQWNKEAVSIARRNVRAILYYLAAQKTPVPRDRLCLLFWPDQPEGSARRNLTRLLTHLRRELPLPDVLVTDQDLVSLDRQKFWCDADEFHRRVEGHPQGIEALNGAIDLVRGSFLDGFYLPDCPEFEQWSSQERINLEILYLQTLASLVEEYTVIRDYESAIHYAQRYLEMDELAEDMQRNLIRLYALRGDRVKALRQYEDCVAILERELGTDPLPETRSVYQAVLQGTLPGIQEEPKGSCQPSWISQLRLDIPLIGRSQILLRLEDDLHKSKAAQSRVVLISGESGIGKTRILHNFVMQHQGQYLLLFGSGDRGEELLPYHPIVEALHSAPHLCPPSLSPVWLAEISRLLPEITHLTPNLPLPLSMKGEEARIRLFEALSRFITALQADFGPILLCLDNLHWFDQTSLSWLIHFCRQYLIKSRQMMVIGTYRSEDVGKVKELRDSLARFGLLDEIKLEGLNRGDTLELLRNLLDSDSVMDTFASRIRETTGGNPFFTLEILHTLEEEQKLSGDLEQLIEFPLPEGVREAINRRLDRLNPGARQILEAGAVLGSKFEFQAVRSTAGRNELETAAGLDELAGRQLLAEEGEGGVYHFSHDLVRRTVLAAISPTRFRLLHIRAGKALEKMEPEATAMLAHHFDLGGEWRRALHYYYLSVQKAEAIYAWQEAPSLYTRMLELLEILDPDRTNRDDLRQRGEILKNISWLYYQAGNLTARDESRKQMDALVQASQDQSLELLSLLLRTRFLHLDGFYTEALAVGEQGLALADRLKDLSTRCRLLTQFGIIYYLLGQPSLALEKLEMAKALTDQTKDIELRGQVVGRIGFIRSLFGHYQEALECLQEAYACHLRVGNQYDAEVCRIEIGRWQTCLGLFEESRQTLTEVLEITRKAGVRTDEGHALLAIGWLNICVGEYDEALHTYDEALKILYTLQNQHLTASTEIAMGVIFYHLGAYEQSRTWLERGLQSARAVHLKPRVAEVLIQLAMLEKAAGNPTRAKEYLVEGLATARESSYAEVIVGGLVVAAGLERQNGDLYQALDDIEEALPLAAQIDLHACEMWARTEASLILMEIGHLEEALEHIRRAVLLIPVSDQAWIRSEQIHSVYSRILEQMGEVDAAAEQAREANSIKQAKAEHISDPDLRRTFIATDLLYLL
jgi:DNA-binding SARP family transcriptional activator